MLQVPAEVPKEPELAERASSRFRCEYYVYYVANGPMVVRLFTWHEASVCCRCLEKRSWVIEQRLVDYKKEGYEKFRPDFVLLSGEFPKFGNPCQVRMHYIGVHGSYLWAWLDGDIVEEPLSLFAFRNNGKVIRDSELGKLAVVLGGFDEFGRFIGDEAALVSSDAWGLG